MKDGLWRRMASSAAAFHDAEFIVTNLQNSLGQQRITVNGVSPKSHFAQVMVEADYRMKLIGTGLKTRRSV